MRRQRAAVGLLAVLLTPTAALAQAAVPGARTARLEGEFAMLGTVTVAKKVTGERRGQKATRDWTFTSKCGAGQCPTVRLVRHRAGGIDRLTLRRRSAGYYTGSGMFYAPLRCASSTVLRGESVPFTITVKIRGATTVGRVTVANRLTATYVNRSRRNLTQCVAIPGHDGARYRGSLVTLAPSGSGGTGPEAG